MVLREAVKNFYLYEVGRAVGFRSVVENLVRLQFISWDVLGVELVVDKPVDDLSLANETGAKDADPSCLHRLISALGLRFFIHLWFLVSVIIN